jgi:NADPH:quinone reductase-like Zn-dependent oxidoreductase
MRAVQLRRFGGADVLDVTDLPRPEPGPGQVLIRVAAAGVNFADVLRRRGDLYPVPTPLPFVPGAEVAGTVAALGPGVDGPAVGTRVMSVVGDDASGGYAEFAVAYAGSVVPIPAGLDDDTAAGVVVAGLTAVLLLDAAARMEPGDAVLVPAAAGGVGGYAVQIAKLLGAGTVIGTAGTEEKRAAAAALGADHVLDPESAGWAEQVRTLTGGRGVDVALEMTGGDRLAETLAALAPFGRLVVYGAAAGAPGRLDGPARDAFLYDPAPNQWLTGFTLGGWFEHRPAVAGAALGRLVEWVAAGQVEAPRPRALPLDDVREAHRALEAGEVAGKLVLRP